MSTPATAGMHRRAEADRAHPTLAKRTVGVSRARLPVLRPCVRLGMDTVRPLRECREMTRPDAPEDAGDAGGLNAQRSTAILSPPLAGAIGLCAVAGRSSGGLEGTALDAGSR